MPRYEWLVTVTTVVPVIADSESEARVTGFEWAHDQLHNADVRAERVTDGKKPEWLQGIEPYRSSLEVESIGKVA